MVRRCRKCGGHNDLAASACADCAGSVLEEYCEVHDAFTPDGRCERCVASATASAAATRRPTTAPGPAHRPVAPGRKIPVGALPRPARPVVTAMLWLGGIVGAVLAPLLRLWLASAHGVSLSVPTTGLLGTGLGPGELPGSWWQDVPLAVLGLAAIATTILVMLPYRRR